MTAGTEVLFFLHLASDFVPLKYAFAIAMLLSSLLATAQGRELEIKVHKGPSLRLLPDTDVITDLVTTRFIVTGVPRGTVLRATLSRGALQVSDTSLAITTDLRPPRPDSNTTLKSILLTLTTVDKKGAVVSTLQKRFFIMPPTDMRPTYIPGVPLPPQPGIIPGAARAAPPTGRIYFSGYRTVTWRYRIGSVTNKTLSRSNERMIRNNVGSSFSYRDSTNWGVLAGQHYRAVDMHINVNGIKRSYHANGSNISMLMSEELRKHQGHTDFILLLHKRFIRGNRTDRIDTVTYTAPKNTALLWLRK